MRACVFSSSFHYIPVPCYHGRDRTYICAAITVPVEYKTESNSSNAIVRTRLYAASGVVTQPSKIKQSSETTDVMYKVNVIDTSPLSGHVKEVNCLLVYTNVFMQHVLSEARV